MPRIAALYGIVIFIYSREHGVPHFHARHGDHEAVVAINSGEVLAGGLPQREANLVAEGGAYIEPTSRTPGGAHPTATRPVRLTRCHDRALSHS